MAKFNLIQRYRKKRKIPALLDIIREFADLEYEPNRQIREGVNPDKEALEKRREDIRQRLDALKFPSKVETDLGVVKFGGFSTLWNPAVIQLLESKGIFYQGIPKSIMLAKIVDKGKHHNMFKEDYKYYIVETEDDGFVGVDLFDNTILPARLRKPTFYACRPFDKDIRDICVINQTNLRERYGDMFDILKELEGNRPVESNVQLFHKYALPYLEAAKEIERPTPEGERKEFIRRCMDDAIYNLLHIRTGAEVTLTEYDDSGLYAHLLAIKYCKPDSYVYNVSAEMYKNGLSPYEVFGVTSLDELIEISPEELKKEAICKFEKFWCSLTE